MGSFLEDDGEEKDFSLDPVFLGEEEEDDEFTKESKF